MQRSAWRPTSSASTSVRPPSSSTRWNSRGPSCSRTPVQIDVYGFIRSAVEERGRSCSITSRSRHSGSTFSIPISVISTCGSVVHMRPLPSDSTTPIEPVSATPKFAPLTATGTERNCSRRCRRAASAIALGSSPSRCPRAIVRSNSAAISARLRWIAGTRMCDGSSAASCTISSARSVSIAEIPRRASASLSPISSVASDLTLISSRAPCASAMRATIAHASVPSRAQCTVPPARVTFASRRSSCSGRVASARALIAAPASRSASQSSSSATAAARLARIAVVALPRLRRSWASASAARAAVGKPVITVPHHADRAALGALHVVCVRASAGRGRADARAADAQPHPRARGRRAAGAAHARRLPRPRRALRAPAGAGAAARRHARAQHLRALPRSCLERRREAGPRARGPQPGPGPRGDHARGSAVARGLPARRAQAAGLRLPARGRIAVPADAALQQGQEVVLARQHPADRPGPDRAGGVRLARAVVPALDPRAAGRRQARLRLHRLALPGPAPRADAGARIHLVYKMHNLHVGPPRRWDSEMHPVYDRVLRRINGMDAMVTLTQRQRDDIAERRGRTSNMFVVPNPVVMPDPPVPRPERDPARVTIVARLEKQKRLTDAIAAFQRVLESVPGARLDIYGDGAEREALQADIDARGLGDSIVLRGFDPRAADTLWTSSAFLMTSVYEGYPLSTLESMSRGCPVVSYDIKYRPREQMTDGVDGFLVPAGDTELLARRVVELLSSPELAQRMSAAARARAESFGPREFLATWAGVLQATVERKPLRTRIEGVRFELTRLEPVSPLIRLLGRRALRLEAVVEIDGRGGGTGWDAVDFALAWVDVDTGAVTALPLRARRSKRRFRLRATIDPPAGNAWLRLRLTWANSAWQTEVARVRRGRLKRSA